MLPILSSGAHVPVGVRKVLLSFPTCEKLVQNFGTPRLRLRWTPQGPDTMTQMKEDVSAGHAPGRRTGQRVSDRAAAATSFPKWSPPSLPFIVAGS